MNTCVHGIALSAWCPRCQGVEPERTEPSHAKAEAPSVEDLRRAFDGIDEAFCRWIVPGQGEDEQLSLNGSMILHWSTLAAAVRNICIPSNPAPATSRAQGVDVERILKDWSRHSGTSLEGLTAALQAQGISTTKEDDNAVR